MKKFDYIITGAGAAGLSLLVHLIRSGKFASRSILLLDKKIKNENDRTWCFWEKDPGVFEDIVYKKWQKLWYRSASYQALHSITPFEYKLIRGIDFYTWCFQLIEQQSNITVQYGHVEGCVSNATETYVLVEGEKIHASYIFNSILFNKPEPDKKFHYLLQHFKGWVIETDEKTFQPDEATLMDFRVSQQYGTTFVYVMPFSETSALVEYTLFSDKILPDRSYEDALADYCKEFLKIDQYSISEKEFGVIPMTDYPFPVSENNIIHIGMAGGQTKASSGYTFRFIQKHSAAIAEALVNTGKPFLRSGWKQKRFNLYDSTLLHILRHHQLPGEQVFTTMMRSNTMKAVLKFLDNETSLGEEIKLIRKLPKKIFIKAAAANLIK